MNAAAFSISTFANYFGTNFFGVLSDLFRDDSDDSDSDDFNVEALETENIVQQGDTTSLDTQKLHGLLRCVECRLCPLIPYYQCQNAHLLCGSCHNIRMMDVEKHYCPKCNVRLDTKNPTRLRHIENIMKLMPKVCEYCQMQLTRGTLTAHLKNNCMEYPITCKYARIGCNWIGSKAKQNEHVQKCVFKQKTVVEFEPMLRQRRESLLKECEALKSINDLMKSNRIQYRYIRLMPCINPKVAQFYEVDKFKVFEYDLSMTIKYNPKNITHNGNATLEYQLNTTNPNSAAATSLKLKYTLITAQYCKAKFILHVNMTEFRQSQKQSSESCVFMEDTEIKLLRWLRKKCLFMRLCMTDY